MKDEWDSFIEAITIYEDQRIFGNLWTLEDRLWDNIDNLIGGWND